MTFWIFTFLPFASSAFGSLGPPQGGGRKVGSLNGRICFMLLTSIDKIQSILQDN